jgi:photosystem I subunit 2
MITSVSCPTVDRIFPSGEVHFVHPKDGFFPEKVNPTRKPVNSVPFVIATSKKEEV